MQKYRISLISLNADSAKKLSHEDRIRLNESIRLHNIIIRDLEILQKKEKTYQQGYNEAKEEVRQFLVNEDYEGLAERI